MARRTDDRSRDIDDAIREQAISRLMALGIAEVRSRQLFELLAVVSRTEQQSYNMNADT
jgi:hypothetical protein